MTVASPSISTSDYGFGPSILTALRSWPLPAETLAAGLSRRWDLSVAENPHLPQPLLRKAITDFDSGLAFPAALNPALPSRFLSSFIDAFLESDVEPPEGFLEIGLTTWDLSAHEFARLAVRCCSGPRKATQIDDRLYMEIAASRTARELIADAATLPGALQARCVTDDPDELASLADSFFEAVAQHHTADDPFREPLNSFERVALLLAMHPATPVPVRSRLEKLRSVGPSYDQLVPAVPVWGDRVFRIVDASRSDTSKLFRSIDALPENAWPSAYVSAALTALAALNPNLSRRQRRRVSEMIASDRILSTPQFRAAGPIKRERTPPPRFFEIDAAFTELGCRTDAWTLLCDIAVRDASIHTEIDNRHVAAAARLAALST